MKTYTTLAGLSIEVPENDICFTEPNLVAVPVRESQEFQALRRLDGTYIGTIETKTIADCICNAHYDWHDEEPNLRRFDKQKELHDKMWAKHLAKKSPEDQESILKNIKLWATTKPLSFSKLHPMLQYADIMKSMKLSKN